MIGQEENETSFGTLTKGSETSFICLMNLTGVKVMQSYKMALNVLSFCVLGCSQEDRWLIYLFNFSVISSSICTVDNVLTFVAQKRSCSLCLNACNLVNTKILIAVEVSICQVKRGRFPSNQTDYVVFFVANTNPHFAWWTGWRLLAKLKRLSSWHHTKSFILFYIFQFRPVQTCNSI